MGILALFSEVLTKFAAPTNELGASCVVKAYLLCRNQSVLPIIMKFALCFAVFLVLAFESATAIKCYVCAKNDGNCQENETNCTSMHTSCWKTVIKGNTGKSCGIGSCKNADPCSVVGDDCEFSCCDTDLCNSATSHVINGVIIMGCSILSWLLM